MMSETLIHYQVLKGRTLQFLGVEACTHRDVSLCGVGGGVVAAMVNAVDLLVKKKGRGV